MTIIKNDKFMMIKEEENYVIYRVKGKNGKGQRVQTVFRESEEKAIEIFNKWYSK